jgi:hypothetical protein
MTTICGAPIIAQQSTQVIADDQTETAVHSSTTKKSVAISIATNPEYPDKTCRVRLKDGSGGTVQTFYLSGDGDGTGVFDVPEGYSVEVTDTADGNDNTDADSDGIRINISAT